MQKILLIGLCLITFSSCTVSKFSNKNKGESMAMKIMEDETFVASAEINQPLARGVKSRGLITVAMLSKVVSVGAQAVKKVIDNKKKKYTAQYSDGLTGLYFYSHLSEKNAWDPDGIQLKEFTFLRTFKKKSPKKFDFFKRSENKSYQIDTAVKITFVLDTSKFFEIYNNSIFRLKVKDVQINYAKAKVPTKHWYFPWTHYQKERNDILNMDIEIDFSSSYNTQDGNFNHSVNLGKFYFLIRDAPLDKKNPNYKKFYDSLAGKSLDGYSFIVPRSYGHYFDGNEYKPCYSQGNYNITLNVKESGQDKFVDKLILDNSDVAIDAIANQVKKFK